MYLFILESIGTQELILIGIIALVVFGPRKLPEMARKLGSMMHEFRKVSGDFRSTWENAVKLEDSETQKKIEKNSQNSLDNKIVEYSKIEETKNVEKSILPEIKEVTFEEFEQINSNGYKKNETTKPEKKDWL